MHPSTGPLALGGIDTHALKLEGAGLTRLALMVGTVFDRMTALEANAERPPK
jgi:hypothetical protein